MVFKKARKYGRRMFSRRTGRRSSSSSGLTMFEAGIGGAAYGIARPTVSGMIPDVPQLGGYSDNVILGGLGALAAWKGSGIVKKAGMVILTNEAFVASSKAAAGFSTGAQSNGGIYIN